MDAETKKEYQSVILAALLHDVGKLLHRGDNEYKYNDGHESASAKFIEKFSTRPANDDLYDIDLVRLIVRHHKPKIPKRDTLSDEYFNGKSEEEKKRIWKLISLVRHADSYSCAERDRELTGPHRTLPLDSIFSNVNLDIKEPQKKKGKYRLIPLAPLTGFPAPIDALTEKEIKDLIKGFEKNIPDFSRLDSFDNVLNAWLNILEEYMWAVPSDTRYEEGMSDVSLYDHLRSSAAIAACLYKRHIIAIKEIKKIDRINEFILIGGDFSGIQNYIFEITNKGSGGASKRLRARSFFITIFSEVTIHKMLHALDLPIVCNLFSAGGKFLLLAPNIEDLRSTLQTLKREVEKEIHRTYFSQFSFLMSWMIIRGFKERFRIYSFFKTADEMFHKLETEKAKKSRDALLDANTSKWNENKFMDTEIYDKYQGKGDCNICGKGPATHEDKDPDNEEETSKCCFVCYRDKKFLGQELPKCNYIAFGKGYVSENDENNGKKIVIFHGSHDERGDKKDSYYVELLESYGVCNEYYLTYYIGTSNTATFSTLVPLKKYFANHVPTGENERVLSFDNIANSSIWQEGEKKYGSDLIGILKVDVDNLGLIFSKGFENPDRAERGLNDIDRKTVSRYLTMSRMLELFFSGWMKEILEGDTKESLIEDLTDVEGMDKERLKNYLEKAVIDFRKIYTVYSGGDDMILVGPWETIIVFSIFLNLQFRKYTCHNKFITLSAGLTFVKPKYPIASAIKQAEALLEKSKEQGKDRITFFGTTVEWYKLPELINFFLSLNEKTMDDNSNINPAFLYRLLEYHRMALRFLDENKIEGLKYLSALSYDTGRNIVERDKNGNIIKGQEEQKILQFLINEKPDRKALIYNVKVPLFWTLYRNRRASKDEDISNF